MLINAVRIAIILIIAALAAPAHAQSDRQLVDRFDQAESAGQHEQALTAALAITERYPQSAFWAFNAGRTHAKLGQTERAIEQLRRAAELGFTGIASFEQHAALDPLRERNDFAAIVRTVRANAEERLAEFKAEAENHEPPTHVPAELGSDRPPVVIALHGTGGTGQQMLDQLKAACDELGMVCIAPDALRPAGDGFSWTYRDEAEWFVGHLIEHAKKAHNVDPDRVVLLGFSQGANIALTMGQTHAELFRAIVPICGHYEPAIAEADAAPARAYLLTGSRDPWGDTYRAARADFTERGGVAELRTVSGLGHAMPSRRELVRALRWALRAE